ncbi:hypothetical protein K1T71_011917 [Dendrolimus kikuchii]|uniref:Uncharacterized protein n=1 Tax=Dendrolimus kikuchii TaxID=765133 RepID=A0ACC1CMH0_9NEOP|nr:hypothetical protein K1T71_011917 [Dendrolimus kikuchii]
MYYKINLLLLLTCVSVTYEHKLSKSRKATNNISPKSTVLNESDDGKSSLVFVFDTTGSMYDDLKQLRAGAEMILNTALKESNIIADFVFVPFHDPAVGPATVTRNKKVFKSALNIVKVHGGGDCPEKSLTGIELALNVSRPGSFIYVFTDATASDHRLVGKVLDAVQRKQSQVVFVLTGHCNDLKKPTYTVYQQIAAASSGQVFNLNKTGVHRVLEFVKSSIKGRTVNLGSVVQPAGTNYTQDIPVDSTVSEVTVSVSGAKPQITVVNPSGEQITGPPKLVTTLDLSEIMVVKVLEPEPGNWSITVGSEKDYSVKVVGLSNLTFNHGFSVERPKSIAEASYRPLQGTYNYMTLSLTKTDVPVQINYAEIMNLGGKTLFEVPLKEFDSKNKVYLTDAFVPPDEFFYIAINGRDENNQEIRRVGATAVQAKLPDVPYLTSPSKVQVHSHTRIVLKCKVESLVPVSAVWTKDRVRLQEEVSSLQTTSIEYTIEDMVEEHVGTYRCIAKNVAGISRAITEVSLIVDPPQVTIEPGNKTFENGDEINIRCGVTSEALLLKNRLVFNGTYIQYVIDNRQEPNLEGFYTFNRTIKKATENDTGLYTCIASNRGGESNHSTHIAIKPKPTAQILGPHDLTKPMNSVLQLVCNLENANIMQWVAPNGTVVKEKKVNASFDDVLEVPNITQDGVWQCVAWRGIYKGFDSVNVTVVFKPKVSIIGDKNITVLNGTQYEVSCEVIAKPPPRILWHKETEEFLNHNVTNLPNNTYRSVLYLNSSRENIEATYFCVGENSEGISQDSILVSLRRKMTVLKEFKDISVQLYSQAELDCQIDSHPPPTVQWYHNGTTLNFDSNIKKSNDNMTVYVKRVDFEDLGVYSCEANNNFENISLNGTMSIHGLEYPMILKESKKYVIKEGTAATIPCRVEKGSPIPIIKWQYRNAIVKEYRTLHQDNVKIQENQITISNVTANDTGVYRCVAENVLGNDVYDVELIVQYPPKLNITEVELKEVKKPREVKAGEKVEFSCKAFGEPQPIIVWTKDGQPMVYTKHLHLTELNDLVIEKATEYDSGLFTCNATSSMGSTQRNFTLFVYVPPNITKTEIEPEVELLEGQLVELPCPVHGVPTPEIEWRQNGELLSDMKKYTDSFGLRFVANLTDFGNYTCNVKNPYGNTSVNYSVYVWVGPYIEPPLEITTNVLIGNNITITCDVVGFPIPVITWEVRGDVLNENTSTVSFNDFGNLYVKNVTFDNEGEYVCVAENLAGIAKKSTYLIVNEAPRILEDNYTGPYLATNMDTSLTISCKATGKPKPYVQWSKDDFYLRKDSRYDTNIEDTLIIKSPTEDMSGNYTCIANNVYGTVNKTIEVRIYPLPTVMQSEESQIAVTVLEGTNTSVKCPIVASLSDTVKWYKDAKEISTDRLQISNVSRDDASLYACVVTNAVGSAHASLYLTVEWPPKFKENITGIVEVVKGEDVYLNCDVDAKPMAKFKWFRNSRQLVFEDNERLKLFNMQPHDSGVYKCVVSNAHGTVQRVFNLNIMVPPFISEFDVLDVLLKEGVNATLECNPKGSPTPSIEWKHNNTQWRIDNTSLYTTNISSSSEGIYRCDATNKAGVTHIVYRVSVVSSAKIQDIVAYKNGEGVSVESDLKVVLGSSTRVACKASGKPNPTVQWIKNGIVISDNKQGIDYADLILEDVTMLQSGVYTCVVANEGGNEERKLKIDVLEPPKIFQTLFDNANISENTINLEVLSGQAFYLHCHPYGNPLPEVYWFKDDLPLRIFDYSLVTMDYGEVISVKKAREDMSGNYTCVARNEVGNTSIVYLVDVLVPPPIPKETTKQINNRVGKPLILNCPVEGTPLPNVMWIKHPYTEIGTEDQRVILVDDGTTLVINKTEVSDSGKYSCIMTNKVGTTEIIFDVTIEKPPSIAGNIGNNIVEGHVVPLRRSIVLKCEADGHPVPKISWLKDTQQLSDSLSNIQRVLGNSLLAIWSVKMRDAGQYICVVENSAGTAHRRYNLAVQVPGKWGDWSQWTYCNVTCGLGYQQRSRICQYIDEYNVTIDKSTQSDKVILDASACKGMSSDRRKCHMPPCEDSVSQPKWSVWARWSACSATCGSGTQARTRRCKSKTKCVGDNVQLRKCPDLPKCKREDETPSEVDNNVYSSKEDTDTANSYLPELTYEMQPEIINSHYSPDVEQFYVASGSKQTTVYYDVEVSQNLDNSDRGPCDPGYRHNITNNACDDIDECLIEINKCHSTQVCINTEGAYRCSCSPGYVSLGAGQRCLDINECEQELDGCEFACVNVAGGYVCACPKHLRLHIDRHHCVAPSLYRDPITTHEEMVTEDYLTTVVDYPSRYTKNLKDP